MGRELRRKQAKKDGKSLVKEEVVEEHQIKNLFTIVLILVILILLIYLISALFITKELDWFSKDEETKEETSNVANTILASNVFNQSEEEYYVYFYDYKEENSAITETVTNKLSDNKVYKVDTNSALNKKYIAETGNKNANNLEELKVIPHTLIKVSQGKIVEYYENEEITNKLK